MRNIYTMLFAYTIWHLEARGSLLEMYWIMRTCLTTSTYQESQYQTMINVEMTSLCYENIMEPKDRNMINTILVVCLPLTFINSIKLYTHFMFCRLLVVVPYIMGVHQWILRKFVTFHHLFAPWEVAKVHVTQYTMNPNFLNKKKQRKTTKEKSIKIHTPKWIRTCLRYDDRGLLHDAMPTFGRLGSKDEDET